MREKAYAILKATEAAALACVPWIGKGQEKMADKAAVDAMRETMKDLNFPVKVVIGEGERDQAPRLYVGEMLGGEVANKKLTPLSVAVDPLEGTKLVARGEPGAMSTIAIGECLLQAPDTYMDKLATSVPASDLSLDKTVEENLRIISQIKNKPIEEMRVCIMDRERNQDKIDQLRKLDAKVILIREGDVSACIGTILGDLDLYIGIGAAPEGVISAVALNCLGGVFLGKLICYDSGQKKKAIAMGVDLNKCYSGKELAKSEAVFIATGITDGTMVKGVKVSKECAVTNSIIISKNSCQYVETKICNR